MARPATGSSHSQPVSAISAPTTTTASDTAASAAMCRKAPRSLRSRRRPRQNSIAVPALTRKPKAAMPITTRPGTGAGACRRRMLSVASAPQATSNRAALSSAARMVERAMP